MELLGMTVPQRLTTKRLKLNADEISKAEEELKILDDLN